jgi:hypothetical protein
MERNKLWFPVALVVIVSLLVAGGMTISAGKALFGDPPNLGAEYRGSESCVICHNGDGAMLWDAWSMTAHAWTVRPAAADTILGDLSDGNAPVFTWPDGEERSLRLSDITYMVGGRYSQRYVNVSEREDGEMGYFVLPVVWNIPQNDEQVGLWTVTEEDWLAPESDWRLTCAGCHTTGSTSEMVAGGADIELVGDWQPGDVEIGIGCEACHGPGGDHNAGTNPMPSTPDAQVCAQCHTQGHDAGGEHPFPLAYQPGLLFDESLFVITGPEDEDTWWATGHSKASANQYGEWLNSAHSTSLETLENSDLAEDSCLRCHAAPQDSTDVTPEIEAQTIEDAQFGVTCVACHNLHPSESLARAFFDLEGQDDEKIVSQSLESHGGKVTLTVGEYLSQGISEESVRFLLQDDPYALCVSCHNSQTLDGELLVVGETVHHPVQEMYEGLVVIEPVAATTSTHFGNEDGPRCMTCHMPRTAEMSEFGASASHLLNTILPTEAVEGQVDTCTGCHGELTATDLQYLVDDTQDRVLERLTVAWARVANVGTPETGSDARGKYDQVVLALNFVQNDGSLGVHNYPYADDLLDFVERSLSELNVSEAGASIQPTEAPAPTAVGQRFETLTTTGGLTSAHGWKPITYIIMGLTLVLLMAAAFAFFRKPSQQEVDA